jgi:hypothetical protein
MSLRGVTSRFCAAVAIVSLTMAALTYSKPLLADENGFCANCFSWAEQYDDCFAGPGLPTCMNGRVCRICICLQQFFLWTCQ